ncbi:MAG: pilus assembly protein [Alphaproteobacteria bacterium]|nr:pilus assembly protein [Alphaproteobacteria bacterium]
MIGLCKRFITSEKATIAVITALCFPVLAGFVTVSIEVARQNYVASQLSFACDAAAVAGARYDIAQFQENATRIFNANFPPGTMGISPVPTFTHDTVNNTITVKVETSLPTKLGKVLGINSLSVSVESQVKREYGGLELVMVLDTTGSMASLDKIGGLRTAAKSLVDVIYEGQNSRENTSIGIVPFVTTVNIGANNTSWLSDPANLAKFPATQSWGGCVKVNDMGEFGDESFDTPPPANKWPVYFVESTVPAVDDCVKRDSDWIMTTSPTAKRVCPPKAPAPGTAVFKVLTTQSGINVGPNQHCSLPILPLVNDANKLKTYIDTLNPVNGGGTMGNLGLVWGGRVISEGWNGQWSVQQPNGTVVTGEPIKAYSEPTNTKALIIMTDGESNWYDGSLPPTADPTSYGTGANDRWKAGKLGSTSRTNFATKIDEKITRLCTALKNRGVEVYTITFRVTSTTVNNVYKNCASTPDHFAAASDDAALLAVFNSIGKQLKRIRISA